jgi:hypothetical protein
MQVRGLVATTFDMKSSSAITFSERPEKDLLRDLANMRDDGIAAFRRKWDRLYAGVSDDELLKRRDELHVVWRRFRGLDQLLEHLETERPAAIDRSAGLQEFAADNYPAEPVEKIVCEHWLKQARDPWVVKWSSSQKQLRANPRSLPAVLTLACIRHADRFGFCRNPRCPAPYFFIRRRDQRYCSADCAGPAKKAAKLRWWHKHKSTKPRSRKSR